MKLLASSSWTVKLRSVKEALAPGEEGHVAGSAKYLVGVMGHRDAIQRKYLDPDLLVTSLQKKLFQKPDPDWLEGDWVSNKTNLNSET
jgi:hypothetical protein